MAEQYGDCPIHCMQQRRKKEDKKKSLNPKFYHSRH